MFAQHRIPPAAGIGSNAFKRSAANADIGFTKRATDGTRLLMGSAVAALLMVAAAVPASAGPADDPFADEVINFLGVTNPNNVLGDTPGSKADFNTTVEANSWIDLKFLNACLKGPGDDVEVRGQFGKLKITETSTSATVNFGGGNISVKTADIGDIGSFTQIRIAADGPPGPVDVYYVKCINIITQESFDVEKTNTGPSEIVVGDIATQEFTFDITATNPAGSAPLNGWFVADTVPGEFDVTDLELCFKTDALCVSGNFITDGGGDFLGLKLLDGTDLICEASVRRPDSHYISGEKALQPEFIVVQYGPGLADEGDTCTLHVTATTDQNPQDKWEPTGCDWFVDSVRDLIDTTTPFFNTIALNNGIKVFNGAGELMFGPKDSIQLAPQGCVAPDTDGDDVPEILQGLGTTHQNAL